MTKLLLAKKKKIHQISKHALSGAGGPQDNPISCAGKIWGHHSSAKINLPTGKINMTIKGR